MDPVNEQVYQIRDLGTHSVTLFPSRAQIVRKINDVPLKAGSNQITIIGLSPTVDEHSVKVEGIGSATITDIAVEIRPNRDIFEDIYPESEDESDVESGGDEEDEGDPKEDEAMKGVLEQIILLRDEEKRAKEIIASAESRQKILESYSKLLTTDRKDNPDVNIQDGVTTYRMEREKVFQDHMDGVIKDRAIAKQIDGLKKEENRLRKVALKEQAKATKIKAQARRAELKEREQGARKARGITEEKLRVRRERESFWPKNVYIVKVSLDASSSFTPMTSRRNSISSDIVKVASDVTNEDLEDDSTGTCDLTMSYVTSYAYWSPSYDLALSTTTNSGNLCFDARLTNMTSETWSNCKMILSTSQADFSGLNDAIPTLVPWPVRLAGKGSLGTHNDIMFSREEKSERSGWTSRQNATNLQKPRFEIFGLENSVTFGTSRVRPPPSIRSPQPVGGQLPPPPPPGASALFGGATTSVFASSNNTNIQASGRFGTTNARPSGGNGPFGGNGFGQPTQTMGWGARVEQTRQNAGPPDVGDTYGEGVSVTFAEAQPELEFQESSFEETGFTSTYDLPSLKTLAPSSTTSKQRVVRITFSSVMFSHTVVAKYKPAAFLKARLRNNSKLTLLKGPTGLTLDGSFMGRTSLPRCSPGDDFSLSLGVDPAIRVAYPKPDVKRSQSGLFSKEDSGIYTRTITLSNTRSGEKGKPVQLTVLDQIPVSEDERLHIEVLQPRGLVLGGSGVAAGTTGSEGKDGKQWGKAVATLKKGGEVAWDVTLNAGRMVKLGLEYECAFPTGDHVVNV
ncbi:hypothetical protein BJ170DRAFT_679706 [Xylariales sp. AK1849]|nr:hypothetical protein BJ170DRAFT_679706 [Xylariales sp. AK1849]